jgi:glycerol-3-phosphate acyltransferase PlsY
MRSGPSDAPGRTVNAWSLLAVSCMLAFAAGSIPFGVLVGRIFYGTDLRKAGSGNIGAANALRTLGTAGALAVLALDALKGFVPAAAVLALGARSVAEPQLVSLIAGAAGFAALLGHCFSPWLHFHGGKGVATHLGVAFALAWPAGLVFMAVWAAVALWSGYSSAGSLVATLSSTVALWLVAGPSGLVYGACASLVIFWRHRENIARLRAGTENTLTFLQKKNVDRNRRTPAE